MKAISIQKGILADIRACTRASIRASTLARPRILTLARIAAEGFAKVKLWLAALCMVMISVPAPLLFADDSKAQPRLPVMELRINDQVLSVEIASTTRQRYMGLSFRETLGNNEGMLFVFARERPLTFTMRNTLIPLSIAYLSKDLTINEIVDMDVGPNQLFPSAKPAMYALEVNQGWFRENNIKPGDQVRLNR